jgi:CPA1 family monovalent cation:H+ antiporter
VEFHSQELLQLLALLVVVGGLMVAAPLLRVPYPILLVLGGLAVAFVPGLPRIELPPELVLIAFLPPLLYSAAFFTSLRDLRANLRPISLLAVGLVLATTLTVALVAHAAIGLPWNAALVLGAIVSPTDPVAATSIARRLGIPGRVVTIVEGESLVNDAVALVAYRVAVAAVVAGSFSLWESSARLVVAAVGGVAIGLAVGYVVAAVRRRLDNPLSEITVSLLTAYIAYLPAEALGVSAVLAAVTAGIYLGWHAPKLIGVQTRLQGAAVWEVLVFVMNSVLFVLVGLQLPFVVDGLAEYSTAELLGYAALVALVVVATRIAWVFPFTYGPRWASRRIRDRGPSPAWRSTALVAWTGMRGAVSLAAALAIPLETDAGTPFPERDLIIFLAFGVILVTLVGQGLSLPPLIRLLGIEEDRRHEKEEVKARLAAAEAALARLEELVEEEWVRDDTAERLRGAYRFRLDRFAARFDHGDDGAIEERSLSYQRLRRELLEAERAAVVQLRNDGAINDDVMRRVERDLDLEDARLDL